MSSALICLNELKGVGVPCEELTPLTGENAIALARSGFTFADSEAFATLANWLTAIANGDILIIRNIRNAENQSVEDGVHSTAYGDKIPLFPGKKGKRFMVTASMEQHEILKTYSNRKWDQFKFDRNNNIIGAINSDGTVQGIPLDYFKVFDQTEPTEADPVYTPIEYQESDPGIKRCYVNPSFRTIKIIPVTHVTITCSTVSAFAFTMTAAFVPDQHFENDGTSISVPLSGLAADGSDIEVIDQGGDVETVTCIESTTTPGTYIVTGVDITSGTCQVKPNSDSLFKSDIETLMAA